MPGSPASAAAYASGGRALGEAVHAGGVGEVAAIEARRGRPSVEAAGGLGGAGDVTATEATGRADGLAVEVRD